MNNTKLQPLNRFKRFLRKFFLSAFVVLSFAAYALHRPFNSASANVGLINQSPQVQISTPALTSTPFAPTSTPGIPLVLAPTNPPDTLQPLPSPTAPDPTATAQAVYAYKNGTFMGTQADAFYGMVQVQVTINNGKITDVQVPEYPQDRRTSARINSIAVPMLQQEALQVQNPANMDIVTGATLTSQAFMNSLQSALDQAKNTF